MDSCTQVKGKLILYKLVLIINYLKLELFCSSGPKGRLECQHGSMDRASLGPH